MKNEKVYIAIGSNLGNRLENIKKAIALLKKCQGIMITNQSSIYKTKPVGYKNQPEFLNCVLEILSNLSPQELLKILQNIESKLLRERNIKWGPRTIDLDILLYGNHIIKEKNIVIPHTQMHKRQFILFSLMEIAPEIIHPLMKKNISGLYETLPKKGKIIKYRDRYGKSDYNRS